MSIKLRVLTYKGFPLLNELCAEFDQQGGTIGRKSGNTLILADAENFVSGHHADVFFRDGQYYIKDTSKNGTYLVDAATNLNEAQAALHDRELLRIGEYEIQVELGDGDFRIEQINLDSVRSTVFDSPGNEEQSPLFGAPLNLDPTGDLFAERPPSSPFHDSFAAPSVQDQHEPVKDIADYFKGLDALSPGAVSPLEPVIDAEPLDDGSAFPIIPNEKPSVDEFDHLIADPTPAHRVEPPRHAERQSPAATIAPVEATEVELKLMQLFLEGAGIKSLDFLPQEQWPDAMRAAGGLFRNLIEGLMDVLRARAEMKSEFRVSVTTIRSLDNNPLKFNPDVESVLKLMLAPNNPAFLNPSEAVSEAFRDIKYHQVAMTAGIQAALTEILHRFEPEGFEKRLGEGILFQKKARCWELYCEKYPELKSLALEDFFGEEFAEAYDKQMRLFARH